MPALTSSQTKPIELLVAYHQNPSIALRNQLVRMNVGLVRKVVHRLSQQCTESFEDLEQVGYLGLINAIERFDPKQGNAFSSFAVPYIRGEILHYLRDRSGTVKIPRRWQDLQRAAKRVRDTLTQELGRLPKDDEIALELGVTIAEWQQVKLANSNRSLLSLDAAVSSGGEETGTTLGDLLPNPQAQKLMSWEEDRAQLQQALNQLEEKTRTIVEQVYLNDVPRKQVAEQMGISSMTVARRLQRGVEQLTVFLNQPITSKG
ncbi:RNA polymerase sigma factor SigF [Pseudanabaena sp. FACHB-2040]|uniref:RNA polymerase sigma factor SigF n=1 Tax=Pseudanabaena sp. FACHB-2040 TaxID=2692859 RepID=UPI0016821EC7|nr:RNA polymerase sigma factor SigF [Pseudanabaena sp. FACHB-2040]MBD0267448.1 RNA polymerase sigma factor SigF [Cyanobacteria bacterium Co-bin8]MBD2259451.1 RNA polymerase sigma factor SigF [Pseudanabaena sp. FACHB-2040]